jgi:ABC-type transport system substrate-binding protein
MLPCPEKPVNRNRNWRSPPPIAEAQKLGGVLIMSHFDSPASMSMLEEVTGAVNRSMMGVFNNLVIYDQHVPQNSLVSIVPDLAMTGRSWNEEGTELTLPLRPGIRWHDGKPFTARDVKCTWDLLTGRSVEKLRLDPRKTWYSNLEEVTKRRVRGHLSSKAAAALVSGATGFRLVTGLPLSRLAARHALASNWHGPVQIRRIPAKRADPGRQKPELGFEHN